MSRFWLAYSDLAGRPLGVVILDSPSLPPARLQVTAERLDQDATFSDGHELEGDSATLVPLSAIGRDTVYGGKRIRRGHCAPPPDHVSVVVVVRRLDEDELKMSSHHRNGL